MNLNSTAIFDSDDMKTIITDLFNKQSSINVNSSSSSMTEPLPNQSSLNEPITTKKDSDRHYCLIIFNNPKWSQKIRKRSPQAESQQTQSTTNRSVMKVVKSEKQDLSMDDLFIAQLRQLIDDYMQHTKRPFPVKYFIDLTNN